MNTSATQLPSTDAPPAEVTRALAVATRAENASKVLVIDSREGFDAAAAELVDLRTRWKAIEAQRVNLKEPFLEGCRRIDAFFREPLDRLQAAGDTIKSRMLTFQQAEEARVRAEQEAQERADREERERLQQQQREAAERERQAREAAEREAREAQERADEEARQAKAKADEEAAAARAAGDEEAAAAAEAQAAIDAQAARERADQAAREAQERAAAASLQAQQDADAAQQALDLADVAPPMPAVRSQAVASGVASRKAWGVKSIDKPALVAAAAKALENGDDSLLVYLLVDDTALRGLAKALKGAARVPGVTFGESSTIATTGRGR